MQRAIHRLTTGTTSALLALGALIATSAMAQQAAPPHTLLGVDCNVPPAYHCPDSECLGSVVTQPGNTV